nr:unnamed protein product [Digitaria exilis]
MPSSPPLPPSAVGAHRRRQPPAPSAAAYLAATLAFLVIAALAYSRAAFRRFPHPPATRRCHPDAEGSWSTGIFLGDSPFSLKPIEQWGISGGGGATQPVANPVVTCADVMEAGFPSSFVANPFLFIQGDAIYMFFETKNPVTSQGDIAAAISKDAGATWQQLGVVLDEEWHLSYPYVFSYENKVNT